MIRFSIMGLMIAGLVVYAWKDWVKSLCGLILMMSVLEHPTMPRTMLGIQGLNPWNLLMVGIVIAMVGQRRRQNLRWDMPPRITGLLIFFVLLIVVGVARAMAETGPYRVPFNSLIVDSLINQLKWLIPGAMLFYGCRTRKHMTLAALAILGMYCLLALQAGRAIRPEAIIDSDYLKHVRHRINFRIGLHPSDLSTMLAGACWGCLAMIGAFRRRVMKLALAGGSVLCMYGQALTGGRAGFVAWAGTGLIVCAIRWRKALLLTPLIPMVMVMAFPAAIDRLTEGFGETDVTGDTMTDDMTITSGRTAYWPIVLEEVGRSPIIGYGTESFWRIGLAQYAADHFNDPVGWPHSAYLEWLLDHGLVGFIPVMWFYGIVVLWSGRLFHHAPDPLMRGIGGMTLAAVLAQLIAGIGSQHFYPREGNMATWASMFLMFRVYVVNQQMQAAHRIPQPWPARPGQPLRRTASPPAHAMPAPPVRRALHP